MRIEKHNETWTGEKIGAEYTHVLFEGLIARKAKILNTIFKNVHFKNCYLGFDSFYSNGWLCDRENEIFSDEFNFLFKNLDELLQTGSRYNSG